MRAFLALLAASLSALAEDGFVTAEDGARLYYERFGSGVPTLIVPARLYLAVDFKPLAANRTVVFYDMRNRGKSAAIEDPKRLSIQHDVSDLEAVRRHFKAEKFATIGYSYLGLMVVMYAAAHPERVDRLVQIGPVPRKWGTAYPPDQTYNDNSVVDSGEWAKVQAMRKDGTRETKPKEYCEQEWKALGVRLVGNSENVAKLGPGYCEMENEWPARLNKHFETHFKSVQVNDFPAGAVARVRMPVLTVHGRMDRNAPYGAGREWAATLPDARLITVDKGAHNSWVDEPDVVKWIEEFLAGRWPARAEKVSG
jgi:pimeloyl-ACP methyl ester carboxylesterase